MLMFVIGEGEYRIKMRRAQVTDLQGLFRLRSQNKKTTSYRCNTFIFKYSD
jgi:hypothetical protein